MKRTLFTYLLLALFLLTAGACTKGTSAPLDFRKITPQEAAGLQANHFGVLIDVREPTETAETGMATGALSLPVSKLDAMDDKAFKEALLKAGGADETIIFYCRSGHRSTKQAERALSLGIKATTFGGIIDWEAAKLPITGAKIQPSPAPKPSTP